MLFRNSLNYLKSWKSQKNRKPIVLRGARQVGKTTLIRLFCKIEKLNLIEINLESDIELRDSFKKMNPDLILKDIQLFKNIKIDHKTLLFIDEIQVVPEALQGLRYFYENKKNLFVVAAGSLLEFTLTDFEHSMPVGRIEYHYVHPMSFLEFLIAKKETHLVEEFKNFKLSSTLSELFHNKFLECYFEYLIVGGMPEAVSTFIETADIKEVQKVHRTIMLNYRNDFSKYAKRVPIQRIEKVFKYIPTHIGQKIRYSEIDENEQSKNLKLALDLLEKASVISQVFHTDASGLPLKIGKSEKVYKLLFLDIGLVTYDLKMNYQNLLEIYNSEKSEIHLLHKGLIGEQFVGQQLISSNNLENVDLYYWLRDEKSKNAEVDFVLQNGLSIVPIEVKSGKTGSIKSLQQFIKVRKSKMAIKLTTRLPQIENKIFENENFKLILIPIYFSEKLEELLSTRLN